jgi:Fe-Mn family superoxide dismutase
MDGAIWRDPDLVQEWAGELSKSEPVVVFCVYGFHVGCKTAIMLREAGFDANGMDRPCSRPQRHAESVGGF